MTLTELETQEKKNNIYEQAWKMQRQIKDYNAVYYHKLSQGMSKDDAMKFAYDKIFLKLGV